MINAFKHTILASAPLATACLLGMSPAMAIEWQGKLGAESVSFFQQPKYNEQQNQHWSVFAEPEFYHPFSDQQELKAKLFYRNDANDANRTHADIRELMFYHFEDEWELNAGIGKVFWGATESRHLVDVINQIDAIESLDDQSRLGQPMVQLKLIKTWGALDLFILPGFRPVQFGDHTSRPRLNPVIADADPIYQSHDKANHIDFAGRWNQSFDDLDLGISFFKGTQRAPQFTITSENGQSKLLPVYVQSNQVGLDLQYIADDLLLKTEAVHRNSHQYTQSQQFEAYSSNALVAGLEYTLVGIFDSQHDLGIIGEYLYDEWEASTPFQRDWMTGLRWVFNDEQSSEILLGHIIDLDDNSQMWLLEGSRRLGENWKLEATGRWVSNVAENNVFLKAYQQDDLLNVKLSYYF